jgi:hypothetical protein
LRKTRPRYIFLLAAGGGDSECFVFCSPTRILKSCRMEGLRLGRNCFARIVKATDTLLQTVHIHSMSFKVESTAVPENVPVYSGVGLRVPARSECVSYSLVLTSSGVEPRCGLWNTVLSRPTVLLRPTVHTLLRVVLSVHFLSVQNTIRCVTYLARGSED